MLKIIYIGQSAGKFRTGKPSTTISVESRIQAIGIRNGRYPNILG